MANEEEWSALDAELNLIAAMLPYQREAVRAAFCKAHNFRNDAFDREIADRRKILFPEEMEDVRMAGQPMVLEDVEPWTEPVRLSALLDEITRVLQNYIIFQHESEAHTLALWVVVTYCSELFNIAPLIGVTALSKNCGKTSLLRILLHLVRKGKPTISLTRATAFRTIDKHHPTIVADEIDKWIANDPQLLTIFLAGHEREFAKVTICVGDDNEERDFDVFGPKVWGQIDLPDEQLVSRSIVIKLFQKQPDQFVLDWPRISMPPELRDMFLRLRGQCLRWMQDSVDTIKNSSPDLNSLSNRLRDNWYPMYCIATLAGQEWKQRCITASQAVSVIDEVTPQITLLRDIRNVYFTRAVTVLPSWLLLADLLLQPESPWMNYERQPYGLNSHQLGALIRKLGIESEPHRFERQYVLYPKADKTQLRGYRLAAFEPLIKAHLHDQPQIVPICLNPDMSKVA